MKYNYDYDFDVPVGTKFLRTEDNIYVISEKEKKLKCTLNPIKYDPNSPLQVTSTHTEIIDVYKCNPTYYDDSYEVEIQEDEVIGINVDIARLCDKFAICTYNPLKNNMITMEEFCVDQFDEFLEAYVEQLDRRRIIWGIGMTKDNYALAELRNNAIVGSLWFVAVNEGYIVY